MSHESASAWSLPLAVLAAGVLGAAWVGLQPKPNQPVAAIFPPWWGLAQSYGAAATADGAVLRTGAWPALIVAYSPDPGFADRLHAAGAWLVLDALRFGICGNTEKEPVR